MQANDKQQSHDEEAHDLRPMHENQQKKVDSICRIRFEEGMDARVMKKQILYYALAQFEESSRESDYSIKLILDRNEISDAQRLRFFKVLGEMIGPAAKKANDALK